MARRNFVADVVQSFRAAIEKAYPTAPCRVHVRAGGSSFGHVQCSNAMGIFKELKRQSVNVASPQAVAAQIISCMPPSDVIDSMSIAGPGFINVTLDRNFVADVVCEIAREGAGTTEGERQRILVDFSSPNVAKEMHVGHLRSTIIGDTLCRILEFSGHEVMRVNHVGDWGTQFGMLIAYLKSHGVSATALTIGDLQQIYRASRVQFNTDDTFKSHAHAEVLSLQHGNEESRRIWTALCGVSRCEFEHIYARLGISISETGESFYNPMIPSLVAELRRKHIALQSDGATVAFIDGMRFPLMIVKSDGGYGYDTTDLAAIRYRLVDLGAQRLIYVTDSGQAEHFAMVFDVARRAKWDEQPDGSAKLQHVGFGLVLGEDGKKFRTRSGDAVRLLELLDEAEARSLAVLQSRSRVIDGERRTHLNRDELEHAARVIGLGAVKYADLQQNRLQDYKFSFDKMLELRGNTAVYHQYTIARIWSILRKATTADAVWNGQLEMAVPTLDHPSEMELAVCVLRFSSVIELVLLDLMPSRLTDYIHELSTKFNVFFTQCPVIGDSKQAERLVLCAATMRVLHRSLKLLGITPLDKI